MKVDEINVAIQKAYARINKYINTTGLEYAAKLSCANKNTILLKREDLQKTHSFKVRGATNFLLEHLSEAKIKGVISASAGNHAQGLAFASKALGIKSTIYMPEVTPKIKIDSVLSFGAEIIIEGKNFEESKRLAQKEAEITGSLFVSPFDHVEVIAGQGTIAIEILQQADKEIDYIFVPVGGGGLITGIGAYIKFLNVGTKIIAVEAEEATAYGKSYLSGNHVVDEIAASFAEGLAVSRIGQIAYDLAHEITHDCIFVNEDEICAAIKDVYNDLRCVVEPSGAASIAGARRYLNENNISGKTVVCILSGANINFDRLRHISDRAEIGEKREKILLIKMPEEPGSLEQLLTVLGEIRVTEFRYAYDSSSSANVLLGFESSPEKAGAIVNELKNKRKYKIRDMSENATASFHARHLIFMNSDIMNDSFVKAKVPENDMSVSSLLKGLSKFNINLVNYRNIGDDYSDIIFSVDSNNDYGGSLSSYLDSKNIKFEMDRLNRYFGDFI